MVMATPPLRSRRTRLTVVADGNRTMLLTHPWAASLTNPRPRSAPA